jgi:hypothetical protein
MATTSMAPERTSSSAISSACSPLSGCETSSSSTLTPMRRRVHRVLGVDERRDTALLLGLGDDVVDERRLTGRLGAEDLDHAAARDAADAEPDVERQAAGRDGGGGHVRVVAELHDRALAELALDLGQGCVERLGPLIHLWPPPRSDGEVRLRWALSPVAVAAGRSV